MTRVPITDLSGLFAIQSIIDQLEGAWRVETAAGKVDYCFDSPADAVLFKLAVIPLKSR